MESRFKTRISRMFRSSFGSSCRSKNLSDVIENPVFVAQTLIRRDCYSNNEASLMPPKARAFPSAGCRPRWPESVGIAGRKDGHVKKVSDRGVYFVTGDTDGRICPPASPISPLNSLFDTKKTMKRVKKTQKKNKKKERSYRLISSSGESNYSGWFGSEDEKDQDETEKFFSSDSSESHRKKKKKNRRRRSRRENRGFEMCLGPSVTKGKVEESFAIVKRSTDPKSDFRNSMVEMIIEKQLFAANDLEQLLQCFLYLNPSYHHTVIVEVFTEIWEALYVL